MRILAIDQATKSGWCAGPGIWGLWNFKTKKDEDNGMILVRLRTKLTEMIDDHKVEMVVYERIASRFATQAIFAAKLVAVIELVCKDKGIPYAPLSAAEIKKFGAGHGKASKEEMVEAAREKYGYDGHDDNIADAIHLYHLAMDTFK